MMSKRNRGWAYPEVKEITHFLLDINSRDSSTSAVEFEYNISDKIGPLFYNGKLNLRSSNAWSVALSNFSMPNNFETFPSIDAESNLSAAYVCMEFDVHLKVKGPRKKPIETSIRVRPCHFPHRRYTPEEVLVTIKDFITKGLTDMDQKGEKTIADKFWELIAHFYIDPATGFVHLKARDNTATPHPFSEVFWNNLKDDLVPVEKSTVTSFVLKGIYIWVGTHIFDYLGPFNGHLWDAKKASGIIFHGDVLDTLIFSYLLTGPSRRPYLISKKSCSVKESAVHVKTDLIASTHPTEYGHLAICTIPEEKERNLNFTPPNLIWRPLRGNNIEKIKFRLTDEKNVLLNYNYGYAALTLLFKPTSFVVFS